MTEHAPSSEALGRGTTAPLVEIFEEGDRFHLPELSSRLPILVHPDLPNVTEANAKWTRRYMAPAFPDLAELERNIQRHTGLWACYLAPLVTSDVQILMTEWTTLLFIVDDYISLQEPPAGLMQKVLRVMNGEPLTGPESAVDPGLEELWGRTVKTFPDAILSRMANNTRRYLDAVGQENIYRKSGQLPTMSHLLEIRRETIDLRFFFTMIEAGLGLTFTESVFDEIEDVTRWALQHIALVNDLLSFRNERYTGDCFNSINAICAQNHVDLQQAVDHLCELIDHAEARFIQARDRVLKSSTIPGITQYLKSLGYALSGNQHWIFITTRYHGDAFRWNGVKSGTVILRPDLTVFVA